MATVKQIKELSEALRRAKESANKYSDSKDDGTCNFDTPQIFLKDWSVEDVHQAFDSADLRCYVKQGKSLVVDIYGCTSGQGSRRTLMAEAVRDSLKADGYEAFVYYQMD